MHDYVEVEVEIVKVTPNAILISDGFIEIWTPKKLIENGNEITVNIEGETITLNVFEWFAYQEGLI